MLLKKPILDVCSLRFVKPLVNLQSYNAPDSNDVNTPDKQPDDIIFGYIFIVVIFPSSQVFQVCFFQASGISENDWNAVEGK